MIKLSQSLGKTLYWSLQRLRGRGEIRHRLHQLQHTQQLSYNDLQEYSYRKLERILIHAYNTVPYYTALMKERGFNPYKMQDFGDLQKLPLLTRADLEKNFNRLKSSDISHYDAFESRSSGSTGQPARFIQDKNFSMWCRAHQLRTYSWCGDWQLGQRFALVWGSRIYWDKQTAIRKAEGRISNRIELNCNDVGENNMLYIAQTLAKFQPVLISGYSTALYLLAEVAKRHGITIAGLRALQPNAEPAYDYMVASMKKQFMVPVLEKYGSTETNIISHQSIADENTMCIQVENTHVEFLNDLGEYCSNGEEGQIIVTTLNNYSMPLIRYQTSDLASPIKTNHNSQYGFPLMSKVRGRMHDLIYTPEGSTIHPQLFSNLFSNFIAVRWFQVVQNEFNSLDISLMLEKNKDPDLESTILKMLNLRTNCVFKVRFHYITELPRSHTGKFKICICNLKKN